MINCHCHSNASYCAEESMSLDLISAFVEKSEFIDKTVISDHSFALYFPADVAWSWEYMRDSSIFDSYRDAGSEKLLRHIGRIREFPSLIPGLEVEMMHDGRFTVDESLLFDIDVIIGSVHWLNAPSAPREMLKYWERHTMRILEKNVTILGHPFRWITNMFGAIPEKTVLKIVKAAYDTDTALELNSHYEIDTDTAMLRAAAQMRVPIAFSNDAHAPLELKDFEYHYSVIKKAELSLNDLVILNPDSGIPAWKL